MKVFKDIHEHLLKHQNKYLGLAVLCKVMVLMILTLPVLQILQKAYAQKGVTYLITATAGLNGTIDPAWDSYINNWADQTYTMLPNAQYGVSDVFVDGSSVKARASYTFTNISAPHTIEVSFGELPQFVDPNTTIRCPWGKLANTIVDVNFDRAITAVWPASNFTINGVEYTPNIDGTSSKISFNLWSSMADGDYVLHIAPNSEWNSILDISAHDIPFTKDCDPNPVITVTAWAGGTVTPVWFVTVNNTQVLTITPDAWYEVDQLTLDGVPVTPTPTTTYLYDMASKAGTVTIAFKRSATGWTPSDSCCLHSNTEYDLPGANGSCRDYAPQIRRDCRPPEEIACDADLGKCLGLQEKADMLIKLNDLFNNILWTPTTETTDTKTSIENFNLIPLLKNFAESLMKLNNAFGNITTTNSKNVTAPRQTQEATFGQKVNIPTNGTSTLIQTLNNM